MFDIEFKDFMKPYKDYTKKPFSFLVNNTTLSSGNALIFRKNVLKKSEKSEKIKTINNKIKQNKTEYDLDRLTAKILALSFGNLGKYEFSTDEVFCRKETC